MWRIIQRTKTEEEKRTKQRERNKSSQMKWDWPMCGWVCVNQRFFATFFYMFVELKIFTLQWKKIDWEKYRILGSDFKWKKQNEIENWNKNFNFQFYSRKIRVEMVREEAIRNIFYSHFIDISIYHRQTENGLFIMPKNVVVPVLFNMIALICWICPERSRHYRCDMCIEFGCFSS